MSNVEMINNNAVQRASYIADACSLSLATAPFLSEIPFTSSFSFSPISKKLASVVGHFFPCSQFVPCASDEGFILSLPFPIFFYFWPSIFYGEQEMMCLKKPSPRIIICGRLGINWGFLNYSPGGGNQKLRCL